MTAAEDFLARAGRADIQRDGWGRPLVVPPEGGKAVGYTRCTTFIDVMEDKTNLTKWKLRSTAIGLAMRRDLLMVAASLGPEPPSAAEEGDWKKDHNDNCEKAIEAAKGGAKANIGTGLHRFTEKLDRGLDLGPVPEEYVPHLKAYEAATAPLTAHCIEQFSVQDDLRIGGTPDRVVAVDGEQGLFIADVKSGSVAYPLKIAMQLAVYARSVLYDPASCEREPYGDVVDLDRGVVMALNQDTGECRLLWVDLKLGWDAVLVAAEVRRWRQVKGFFRPMETGMPTIGDMVQQELDAIPPGLSLAPPQSKAPPVEASFPLGAAQVAAALAVADLRDPATMAAIRVAINHAASPDELYALWSAAGTAWTLEFTQLAAARKQELAR